MFERIALLGSILGCASLASACAFHPDLGEGERDAGNAGEGEGEGDEGEGELDGGTGGDCDTSAFGPGNGGLVLADCTLENDFDNIANCPPDTGAFLTACAVDGVVRGDCGSADGCSGNEVRVSVDGTGATFCSSFPVFSDGFLICPLCFFEPPKSLAIQLDDDDISLSNPACVDTSSASAP